MNEFASAYLEELRRALRGHKRFAESAIAQLTDAQLFSQLDPEANSVPVLMKHIAGNMRSRFTDFLTSDGEKPDRFRDREFEVGAETTRASLFAEWENGWKTIFATIASLQPDDLQKTVTIRNEPHSVLQALNRAQLHYAQHIGQIVLLAKHLRGADWKTLSIPKGRSEEFKQVPAGKLGMPKDRS